MLLLAKALILLFFISFIIFRCKWEGNVGRGHGGGWLRRGWLRHGGVGRNGFYNVRWSRLELEVLVTAFYMLLCVFCRVELTDLRVLVLLVDSKILWWHFISNPNFFVVSEKLFVMLLVCFVTKHFSSYFFFLSVSASKSTIAIWLCLIW